MNILSIEKARTELLNFLENTSSRRLKLKKISEFFALLIEQKPFSLAESYLLEFLLKYLDYLKSFSLFGVEPNFSQNIISTNEKLINLIVPTEFKDQLVSSNEKVKKDLETLFDILNGNAIAQYLERKVLFPVIEDNEQENKDIVLGAIDSLTIKITRAKSKDKFIVVPSENEKDKQLEEQIHTCWLKAKDYCKKYVKRIAEHHEVIISFDGNLGIYRGDSLGTALIIGFVEELLKHYNSQTVLIPTGNAAFTGGLKENGELNHVTKDIIEKKVEIAFFSNCGTLAVPKLDEPFALYKLDELKNEYPARVLTIVGVKDVAEILLRRDLVEIKKQKLVVRTGKFVKKNWVSAVVTVLLAVLFAFLFVMDFDDNPARVAMKGQFLHVENKKGKVLWAKKLGIDLERIENRSVAKMLYQFENINEDEYKELIICYEFFNQAVDTFDPGRIVCYDYLGKMLWQYVFQDSVFTKEKLQPLIYSSYLVDLRTEHNKKVLYAIASNSNFASAVYRLNALNGERLEGTLWNAGHFQDGIIADINSDGKEEIVLTAINNGYERSELVSVDLGNLEGQLPTTENYLFYDIDIARYNKLVLLPVTDYAKYMNARFSMVLKGGLRYLSDEFSFITVEDIFVQSQANLNYRFDVNLICIDVECSDVLQVKRDSLIMQNILKKPFTNSTQYESKLINEIIYKEGLQRKTSATLDIIK